MGKASAFAAGCDAARDAGVGEMEGEDCAGGVMVGVLAWPWTGKDRKHKIARAALETQDQLRRHKEVLATIVLATVMSS